MILHFILSENTSTEIAIVHVFHASYNTPSIHNNSVVLRAESK